MQNRCDQYWHSTGTIGLFTGKSPNKKALLFFQQGFPVYFNILVIAE
jgi:hypothetical protein